MQLVQMRGGTQYNVHLLCKVGNEAIDLQVESTVWTYYVHIFSLCTFPSVGLQCALIVQQAYTWLTCNCVNILRQQGLE